MKAILPLLTASLLLVCCRTKKESNLFHDNFNPTRLLSQFVTIDVTHDTSFTLTGGTKLFIRAASLFTPGNRPARLEIKEALTIDHIVRAGLFTRSGNHMLQSGGMLLIQPAEGEKIELRSPINAEIPAEIAYNNMKLYKGKESGEGIDWQDPSALQITEDSAYYRGEILFNNACRSCHMLDRSQVGNALAGMPARWPDRKTLRGFLHNPAEYVYKAGDQATCCIAAKHGGNGVQMPGFLLGDNDIDNLVWYIQKESAKKGITADSTYGIPEECKACVKTQQSVTAMAGSFRQTATDTSGGGINAETTKPSLNIKRDAYTIRIEEFGWHNVDVLSEEDPRNQDAWLTVQTARTIQEGQVCLVIPSYGIFMNGEYSADLQGYYFKTEDGNIRLPLGAKAYVFCLSSGDNAIYYDITSFTIRERQQVKLTPIRVAQSYLEKQISSFAFNEPSWNPGARASTSSPPTNTNVADSISRGHHQEDSCSCSSVASGKRLMK